MLKINKKKICDFSKEGIEFLSKDKPVVYKIENNKGNLLYVDVAKRGRVEERLKEHLPCSSAPIRGGSKVKIIQKSSINKALKAENRIIKQPKTTAG